MHRQEAAAAFMRPHQQQLFMLGALALHLVPAWLIGMQWQEFRLSAASSPREQVLRVELLSPMLPRNDLALLPGGEPVAPKPEQAASPAARAASTPVSGTENDTAVVEGRSEDGTPQVALPLVYLSSRELDEGPWAEVPVLIPFPETAWQGGHIKGVLELFISENGSIDRIQVGESTLPEEFERAAIQAFRQVKMRPGMKEGKPVRSVMKILVEFEQR